MSCVFLESPFTSLVPAKARSLVREESVRAHTPSGPPGGAPVIPPAEFPISLDPKGRHHPEAREVCRYLKSLKLPFRTKRNPRD